MAKYKAYAEYRDSGVEWLGKTPLNWQIHSLKRAVEGCTNGFWGGEPDDRHDLIVLRVADFDRQSFKISDLKITTRSILPKDRGIRLLKSGDLLIEKSGGGDKTLVGCVVLFDKKYEAVTSNFVAKMPPRGSHDSQFLTYAFSKLYAGKVNYPSIKQTTGIQNLDSDAYLMEKFCFPPKHEQRNISCFLDYETEKIDNLIEKQQLLVELLKEKRQAVISHAVTKGLTPDVPKQYSGIELLGDIPLHWVMSKLRYNFIFGKGLTITKENLEDDGTPCINYGEVHSKYPFEFTPNTHQLRFVSNNYIKNKPESLLIKGDIVFADTSEDIDGSGNFTQLITVDTVFAGYHTIIARPFERNNFRFYAYLLDSKELRTQVRLAVKGVKVFSVTQAILRSLSIWLPPKDEQALISSFLDHETAKIDTLIEKQLQQIELLKERRTALISAAVTGKIDVRDWVAPETLATQPQDQEEETFA